MKIAVLVASLVLGGCGHYADFALPAATSSGPHAWISQPATGESALTRGSAGEWDSSDALNPALVRFQNQTWNLYSGFDGKTWRTGVAVEEKGRWEKRGMVLSPEGWEGSYIAANGAALERSGKIFYWYETGSPLQIALAQSEDGRAWLRHGSAVVPVGPAGSFDEMAVADPYVIEVGKVFYLFYLGQDRARRQRLGLARSTDGIVWEKFRQNPILELGSAGEFDEMGLGEPAVWASGGKWWMLYTGRDRAEHRKIGMAESVDGIHWTRTAGFAPISGGEAWNRQVVCDPHVLLLDDGVLRVWYGGGNQPRPAEGLDGSIGVMDLAPKRD